MNFIPLIGPDGSVRRRKPNGSSGKTPRKRPSKTPVSAPSTPEAMASAAAQREASEAAARRLVPLQIGRPLVLSATPTRTPAPQTLQVDMRIGTSDEARDNPSPLLLALTVNDSPGSASCDAQTHHDAYESGCEEDGDDGDAAQEDAAPAGAGCTAAPSPADAGDLAAPPPPIADELTAAPAHAAGPAAHDGLEDAEACNEDPGTASFAECADAAESATAESATAESATAESATAETRRVLSTIKALREQVAGLQSELRLSESDRVSQLRQEFNIALDVALDASRSFRQAVLVGDRLHALVETANEMLTRNQCSLPLDDLLRWQTLHKTMVRALVESGEKLRALKSAIPGVQSVVRICETPGLRQQGDSE